MKLRIAYISFEHPSAIAAGGIGTYIGQVSALMAKRGHSVEVFSGTLVEQPSAVELNGYLLHLVPSKNNAEFRKNVVAFFASRHAAGAFDLIESPEYGADGLEVKKAFPAIPLTLKLHTPSFLLWKLNGYKHAFTDKLRFVIGGLLRLKKVKFYWVYDKETDPEYELFQLAESISSPSVSLSKIVSDKWGKGKPIAVMPYPYESELKEFKPITITANSPIIVTFVGKLEKRKGILHLMNAIPAVLKAFPDTIFRFVGNASPSPDSRVDMVAYMKAKLSAHLNALEFLGFRLHHETLHIIEESHICIFPSLWENFPNVCLEAMSAGRVVVGTNNGGMADMITNNVDGVLIPPRSPKHIVDAIKHLIANKNQLVAIGNAAKVTVAKKYNGDIIGPLTEQFYLSTIND